MAMELNLIADERLNENRDYVSKPIFKIEELYNYLEKYKAYFNDNFGLRSLLIKANLQIKYWFLNKSPVPNSVIIGKDGWLFLSPEKDIIISDKADYLHPKAVKILVESFVNKTKEFKKYGITYYVMLIPEKSYSYNEMLPVGYDKERVKGRFDQLLELLQSNPELNIINSNEVILNGKNNIKDPLYLKYDAHWNTNGALLAYHNLIAELKKAYPKLNVRKEKEYKKTFTTTFKGDLAKQMNMMEYFGDKEYKHLCFGTNTSHDTVVYSQKSSFSYAYENTLNNEKPDILFLHDSFGVPLIPWLINDFHIVHSLRIFDYNFDVKALAKAGPKIVVHEMVPRNTPIVEILSSDKHLK